MSLELQQDVAENVTTKETLKMIRETNQGHLQFTSQWRQQKGKNETKRRKKIKDRKKKGCRRGGKKINNPEKRIFFYSPKL